MKTLLSKLWPYLLMAALGVAIYLLGIHNGKDEIQSKWDASVKISKQEQDKLKDKYHELERQYNFDVGQLSNQLHTAKTQYKDRIDSLTNEYAARLQQSSERADIYERKATSGAAECRSLASHAIRLDRTLEEGRHLVGELQTTIRLRDSQIKALAAQIQADHKLLN